MNFAITQRSTVGSPGKINWNSVWSFLHFGFLDLDYSYFYGLTRQFKRTQETPLTCSSTVDFLKAQTPKGRFALALSGGRDSMLLAMLYDNPDAVYFHCVGVETDEVEQFEKMLKGKVEYIQVTPAMYLKALKEDIPRLEEPSRDSADGLSLVLWRAAAQQNFKTVITGEDANLIFGGSTWIFDPVPGWDKTQTLRLVGLTHGMPYFHQDLVTWAMRVIVVKDKTTKKKYIARECKKLGLPSNLCNKTSLGWGGCWNMVEQHRDYIENVIQNCMFSPIQEYFRTCRQYQPKLDIKVLYRLFSITVWLERCLQHHSQ